MQLVTFESVKMYFGTYVFFSSDALPTTEFIASVVDSRMNENRMLPQIRYSGKLTSLLRSKIRVKTIAMTAIDRSGVRMLQR